MALSCGMRGSLGNPRANGVKTEQLILDTDSISNSEAEEGDEVKPREQPITKRNETRGNLTAFLKNNEPTTAIDGVMNHYMSLCNHFDKYSYALTISPKSTAFTKCKKVSDQYRIFANLCKDVFDKVQYIAFYELYKDGENLHMHAIIKFDSLNQFTETRKAIYFKVMGHHLEKRASYKPLIDMSRVTDLTKWSAYCIKDIEHTYKLGLLPTFKIQH